MGIEPTCEAWEAPILPLNYARKNVPLMYQKTPARQRRFLIIQQRPLHRRLTTPQNYCSGWFPAISVMVSNWASSSESSFAQNAREPQSG